MAKILLKDKYPEIFAQIDVERTKKEFPDVNIDKISYGSNAPLYFRCAANHSYISTPHKRIQRGCPICANQKVLAGYNDLETYVKNNPEYQFILDSWDYEKNIINPSQVIKCSNKKVYFKCCNGNNHSYLMSVKQKHIYRGCPICSGHRVLTGFNDLQTWVINNPKYQFILDEWDYKKNNLLPTEITPHSAKEIYFICNNGHSFSMELHKRTLNSNFENCPICSNRKLLPGYNDLQTWIHNHPEFQYVLDEWDYDKNLITPSDVMPFSLKKVWFKCNHGHSYETLLSNKISRTTGCPICVSHISIPELVFNNLCKKYIDKNSKSSRINGYEIDIFIPSKNICTEYDGAFYHNSEDSKIRENNKNTSILEDKNNYKFIRIKETNDEDNIAKFKEILDNGLIIYYINTKYNDKYFKRFSEIFYDIFKISINFEEIKKVYFEQKRLRNN